MESKKKRKKEKNKERKKKEEKKKKKENESSMWNQQNKHNNICKIMLGFKDFHFPNRFFYQKVNSYPKCFF